MEEALQKNIDQWTRIANHGAELARDKQFRSAMASDLWDAVNA